VKFDSAIFKKIVDFRGTTFMLVGFRYTKFFKYAGFEDTTFSGYAVFDMLNSWARLISRNSQFSDGAEAYFTKRNSEIMLSSGA
jgi:hypothetical protein